MHFPLGIFMLEAFYSDHFVLPLPPGHRFPMEKYQMLRDQVALYPQVKLQASPLASVDQLLLAHTPEYVDRVLRGLLSESEQREIGFPWSEKMVIRSRHSAGATIAATLSALNHGVSVNLAGGTHHAYAAKGSGFCVFNDAAIAAKNLQILRPFLTKVAIIDLDVHQGNGTAAILQGDPSVFTFSMHGEKNFPFRKEASDLDVSLNDGTTDDAYLSHLESSLNSIAQQYDPDSVIYLAGADPFVGDRLGRLDISMAGLAQRDEMVLQWCSQRRIPVAIAMAGGYANVIAQTVAIHAQTVKIAAEFTW